MKARFRGPSLQNVLFEARRFQFKPRDESRAHRKRSSYNIAHSRRIAPKVSPRKRARWSGPLMKSHEPRRVSSRRGGGARGGAWTPSGCCSPRACGRPRAACPRRSGAAGPGGCLGRREEKRSEGSAFFKIKAPLRGIWHPTVRGIQPIPPSSRASRSRSFTRSSGRACRNPRSSFFESEVGSSVHSNEPERTAKRGAGRARSRARIQRGVTR